MRRSGPRWPHGCGPPATRWSTSPTRRPRPPGDRARGAIADGVDALAVVGGDGMVHLGVNLCAGTGVPLAIIAAGTGNDIAREARPAGARRRREAADLIHDRRLRGPSTPAAARRRPRATTAGSWGCWARGSTPSSTSGPTSWRWPKGRMRYNLAILRELPLFRAIPYVVERRRRSGCETEAMLVAVGNGPSLRRGDAGAPGRARSTTACSTCWSCTRSATPEFLRVFPKVFKGTHVTHPAVRDPPGPRGAAGGGRASSPYADGERFAPLPMTLEVVPGAVHGPGLSADVA